MPYNDSFTKMVGDTTAAFKAEITAVQDNVTDEVGAPELLSGKYHAKGDLNAILQEIVNNDVILKAITDKIISDLGSHSGNKNNPHTVTKAQVGLGSVENYPTTSSVSDSSNSKYTTAGAVKIANDNANGRVSKAGDTMTGNLKLNQGAMLEFTGTQEDSYIKFNTTGSNDNGWIRHSHKDNLGFMQFNVSDDPTATSSHPNDYFTFGASTGNDVKNYIEWLKIDANNAYYKGNAIYHTGNKPTKSDVGLSNVANYPVTSSISDASNEKYATAGAVKSANDNANGRISKSGDTMTGKLTTADLEVKVATGTGAKFGSSTHKALVGTSSSAGEYLFGGNKSGSSSFEDFIRIGNGKLKYGVPGTEYDIYHTGNKPSKADVGLSNVANYPVTSSVSDAANDKYSTAGAVKQAYDRGSSGITEANKKVNKEGDTMTGNLVVKISGLTTDIKTLHSAPLDMAAQSTGNTTGTYFAPMTHQKVQHGQGYMTHVTTGLVKSGYGSSWGEGVSGYFVATGGSDASPTEYFTMAYGGKIKHSRGHEFYSTSFKPTASDVGLGNVGNYSAVNKSGDTMGGILRFNSTPVPTDTAAPTQLGYGCLSSYGPLRILANTDNSAADEPVIIAAKQGMTSSTTAGLTVGDNYIRFKGNDILCGIRYTAATLRHRPEGNDNKVAEFGSGILVTACTYGEGTNAASQQTRQIQVIQNNAWVTVGY